MLVIRLMRTGKKNASHFRVVLIEKTAAPQSGNSIEILGNCVMGGSVKKNKKEVTLKKDRINYWLSKGVQVSDSVYNLLIDAGIVKGAKIRKFSPRKKKGGEEEKPKEEVKKEEKVEETKKEEEPKAEDLPEESA